MQERLSSEQQQLQIAMVHGKTQTKQLQAMEEELASTQEALEKAEEDNQSLNEENQRVSALFLFSFLFSFFFFLFLYSFLSFFVFSNTRVKNDQITYSP